MKRLSIAIFCLGVLALVATTLTLAQTQPEPTVTPTSTPTPTRTPAFNVVLGADVFLRGGPGEVFLPVGALQAGDIINPVSRNEDATWIMITYRRGFGWIRSDLASWVLNLNSLPVIDSDNLTPSPIPGPETATPFFPTETPVGNYVNVVGANSALVRAGPGTTYLRLGQLFPGDLVEPVGRNATGGWILIRFSPASAEVLGADFSFGWIQRNLVNWLDEESLDDLPILTEDDLTPTITFTPSITPTVTNTPSATLTATNTSTATLTPTVTLTPTLTATLTPTSIPTATPTETYTYTPTATLTETITPTFTDVPSNTPTETLTNTPPATLTDSPTWTSIPTSTLTDTPTSTLTQTGVPTLIPSETNTSAPTVTETSLPTDVPSETFTVSPEPSETIKPTDTHTAEPPTLTPTEVASDTPVPTLTYTSTATPSNTALPPTPTAMPTETLIPTETPTPEVVGVVVATSTEPLIATETNELPTPTGQVVSETPTDEATEEIAVIATEIPVTPQLSDVDTGEPEDSGGGGIPAEAIVGGIGVLVVLGYVGLYLRGLALVDRYANGFVIEGCPVCQRGHLTVDTKVERVFGVPRPRRTIRCDVCRSVLRQTSDGWWRYAVDRLENPAMYDRFNNREIDDSTLVLLGREPVRPHEPRAVTPPTFVEEDDQES